MIISINPYTQKIVGEYLPHTAEQVELFLSEAAITFVSWSHMSFMERGKYIVKVGEYMQTHREELALLSTEEMWMLYSDALADIDKTVTNIKYFVENSQKLLSPKKYDLGEVRLEPLWAILIIAPWNYPYNQWLRNAIPQLMAGNVVLLKHASNLPRVSMAIQSAFEASWIPQWVFQTLLIPGKDIETLIADSRIVGVSITSGESAGRSVGSTSGKNLKPTVLELGWNDACIVLPDAEPEESVPIITKWRMSNGWQKCNAIKRLILIGERSDINASLLSEFQSFIPWDPMLATTTLPPLVNAESVATIAHMVEQGISEWARVLTGWEMITLWEVDRPQFYLPTILTNVSRENSLYDTEIFGPVLIIYTVNSLEEAIILANDSQYWLWCVVIGKDETSLSLCAREIQTGNIAFNTPVTSYPHIPYGGIKNSGYGRELWESGITAFMNVKTIVR